MNILLADEYDYLTGKKEKLEKLHLDAGQRVGAACQESETFHDNPEMEYARDDQLRYSKQISEIDKILSNCKIIKPEDIVLDGKVRIGTIVDLEIDGTEEKYKIGGADTSGFNDRVSYKAPIIAPLLGKEIDDEVRVEIAGKVKEILIVNINK